MYAYDCCKRGFKLIVVGGPLGCRWASNEFGGWWLWYECLGVLLGLVVGGSKLFGLGS